MTTRKLITLFLLIVTNFLSPLRAQDAQGHFLTRLWADFEKAVDADKPKDQAAILEQIKQEASARKLAWDYYDASMRYVDVRSSTDWKLRGELNEAARQEIESFGEPVAVFYYRKDHGSGTSLLEYVNAHREQLLRGHNTAFYDHDYDLRGFDYADALLPRIANDYEYALWSLFGGTRSEESVQAIRGHFSGRYPFDAFIEFTRIRRKPDETAVREMEVYVAQQGGRATALLGRQFLLQRRHNALSGDRGTEAQFRALADDCERFIADRKRFSGEEKTIADCCRDVDAILESLRAEEVMVEVEDGRATLLVRNLPSVRLRILDGKQERFDRTLDNPARRFHVRDTLTLTLPELDDKSYTLKVSGGKVETESEYRKYTLSIAHKRDLAGYGVFVADYLSGEPVERCDLVLRDSRGNTVERLEGFRIDGFSYLPEPVVRRLEAERKGWTLQAESRRDGRVRLSPLHSVYPEEAAPAGSDNPARHRAMILTDRSAFRPDETVHYKVLLYEGTYEYAVRPAGLRLRATLTDPSGRQVAEQELSTGEFGSAAGSFVLRKGERGGMYRITVYEGQQSIASTQVRADEFVLPEFELTWNPDDRFYLPGDDVLVTGQVRSYSGHTLSGADARYSVTDRGERLADGDLSLAADGSFAIRFRTPEADAYYRNPVVTVRVTDATGETLEFTRTVSVSRNLPLNLHIMNSAAGRFESVGTYRSGSIVGEDRVELRLQLGAGERRTHPRLHIEYKVLHEGREILSGTAPNGEVLPLDLSGQPSGLYTIEATATARSDEGTEYSARSTHDIVKATDRDTALDFGVRCFFRELPDDGRGIALQVGTTTGPAWIVAELYGDGNRLLAQRIVRLEGALGRDGSLQIIRFERRDDYPEALSLKLFWFHDGRSFEYSVSSYKPKLNWALPLRFSRFLDTTAPGHDYSFTIQTEAGVEVAATVFDKSTETLQPNRWFSVQPARRGLPDVGYGRTTGMNASSAFDTGLIRAAGGVRMLAKSSNAAVFATATAEAMMLDDALDRVVEEEEAAVESFGADTGENLAIREDFAATIAWEPFLRSDEDGVVRFDFRTADKLSTYYVQLFAHDKEFHNATLRQEMVVTLPVKVSVVQPQFLYGGDRYVARVSVANSQDTPVQGTLSVRFLDGTDYRTAPMLDGRQIALTVPAGGSADYRFEIEAPAVPQLGLLVNFTADREDYGSDGVFVTIPVAPAVQTLTEAHSALLLAGQDREALIASLRSQFVNMPGASASLREISILDMIREAVPEKVLPASDNLLDQSEALYANYLLDLLPGGPGSGATAAQREEMVSKILACRDEDGGFGWFAGMNASPLLTAVLLERLADMGDACPQALRAVLSDAVRFLDESFFGKRKRPIWIGGLSLDQYLHVRALYPELDFAPGNAVDAKELRDFKKEVRAYLVPGAKRGLNGQVFAKARRMKTLRALLEAERGAALARSWGISLFTSGRLRRSLDRDIASLLQYAEPHRSGGTYYPNAVMPWRGLLESELYAHALICELLTDCGYDEVAEGIRLWLMVQKETQQWADDPAYIQAIGCVLRGREETLQTRVLALSASATLPFPQLRAAGNGFTLSYHYTRDGKVLEAGDVLHVGDRIEAVYTVHNDENRSFVRLTAPRPAAFRPVEQRSGYQGWQARPLSITGWVSFSPQGYRSVLADRTEFWFDVFPEEQTTLRETYFVTQEGTFQVGAPVIESLYANHYRANADGRPAVSVR